MFSHAAMPICTSLPVLGMFIPIQPMIHNMSSSYMGVSIKAGTPIAGWFIDVYFMENPNLKWMTGGTPMT